VTSVFAYIYKCLFDLVQKSLSLTSSSRRLLAQHAPPSLLAPRPSGSHLRKKVVDWLHITLAFLKDARPHTDLLWDNVQVGAGYSPS
jgi:hypothetical protein